MFTRQLSHTIRLSHSTGATFPATLACEERSWSEGGFSRRICTIKLSCDRCEAAGEGHDFFDAFCRVREAIEVEGLTALCYGASRNVYPSAMARDMGAGLKAYKMRLGVRAKRDDIVAIFSEGEDVEPASVEAQREFWRTWLRSCGFPAVA